RGRVAPRAGRALRPSRPFRPPASPRRDRRRHPWVPLTVIGGAYPEPMPLEPPRTLTPSKVSSFTDCALAFRFSAIDRLPEPPSVAATRGTLVHRALELLMLETPAARTLETGLGCLDRAAAEIAAHADSTGLDPAQDAAAL